MNINDYTDGNGNVQVSEKLIQDLISNISDIKNMFVPRFSGQLPTGNVNLVSYWNNISSGTYLSNANQTNTKGAWAVVEVLKAQTRPSSNQAQTRILWYNQTGTDFFVGTFTDATASDVIWRKVTTTP